MTYRLSASLALLAAAAVVALAGCGGSRSPSVASVATTTSGTADGSTNSTGTAASGPAPSESQTQQDALQYARCMRANGEPNFPDPSAGGGFVFQPGAGVDPSSPAFKAAQAKCQRFLPSGGAGLAPGSATHPSAQWLAHMVKVSGGMRRRGISDFPDPRTSVPSNPFPAGSPGGVISDIQGVILVFPATIDTQSPLFTRAAKACGFHCTTADGINAGPIRVLGRFSQAGLGCRSMITAQPSRPGRL